MSIENNILVKLNEVGFHQNKKWLVKGVSLQVERGKIVTLIGPNGSGKSTTAKIALGIYKNIEGQVEKFKKIFNNLYNSIIFNFFYISKC